MKTAYTAFDFTETKGHVTALSPLPGAEDARRREFMIQPGVVLSVMDFVPRTAMQIRYEKDTAMINFGFVAGGRLTNEVSSVNSRGKIYRNKEGIAGIHYRCNRKGQIFIPPQKRLQVVHIHLTPQALNRIFERDSQNLPNGFRQLIHSSQPLQYDQKTAMTPRVFEVVRQILKGPEGTLPDTLFYECKGLELLCLQIGTMGAAQRSDSGQKYRFSKTDIERIREAEHIIGAGIDTWPVVAGLASAVGMGSSKLKAGFRHVYGMPVSCMVKEKKMNRAKALLEEREMNVSQTAWELGYTNVSHFCTAFKKQFGILPGAYLKSIQKQ